MRVSDLVQFCFFVTIRSWFAYETMRDALQSLPKSRSADEHDLRLIYTRNYENNKNKVKMTKSKKNQ